MKKQLTVWEAACIITGYSVGGGIMALPYLTAQNGIAATCALLVAAFLTSLLLHLMIADICVKCGNGAQIVSVFSKYLFRGKLKNALTAAFFVLIAFVLVTNLSAYIVGAGEIVAGFLSISPLLAELLFYVFAAIVVMFGLKAVGISEKFAVCFIFALIGALAIVSLYTPAARTIPVKIGENSAILGYFSMAMLSFSAFFSIPQAVEGLNGDHKKIRWAVFIGLINNLILIVVISLSSLRVSTEVTEVAMQGWSAAIGRWAEFVGGAFTLLAMLTTYWSISLALSNVVREQTKWDNRVCWVSATLPSLLLSLFDIGGFIDFLELAGGAIAIIVAVMVVPAYRNARRETEGSLLKDFGSGAFQIITVIAYLLMAVGCVI